MGVKLTAIVPRQGISFDELSGKKIAVDFSNAVFQFLSSIRQTDGTPLMDSHGNITSHLQGLFARSCNLLGRGIKLCYVFDGAPPKLKIMAQRERRERKLAAKEKFSKAMEEEDIEAMRRYAKQTSFLNEKMVQESMELLKALGLPIVQSPSEADAQAAFMCKNDDVWVVASSDYDCLLYGAKRMVTNLTVSQKRRLPSGTVVDINPDLIALDSVLGSLEINQEQLITLAILIGTDYNLGGVKGIGPKNALKLVKGAKNKKDFGRIFKQVNAKFDWEEIYNIFKKMPVDKNYKLEWKNIDIKTIKDILVKKHDFSEERINKTLEKLEGNIKTKAQTGLNKWI